MIGNVEKGERGGKYRRKVVQAAGVVAPADLWECKYVCRRHGNRGGRLQEKKEGGEKCVKSD